MNGAELDCELEREADSERSPERKTRKRFRTLFNPRFSDFDLQGVLNSAQYMDFVTEARADQMEKFYLRPVETYTAKGQSFVITGFSIQYRRAIVYGSKFWVETEVVKMRTSRVAINYAFLSEDLKIVHAKGEAVYHLYDLNERKIVPFSREDVSIYL